MISIIIKSRDEGPVSGKLANPGIYSWRGAPAQVLPDIVSPSLSEVATGSKNVGSGRRVNLQTLVLRVGHPCGVGRRSSPRRFEVASRRTSPDAPLSAPTLVCTDTAGARKRPLIKLSLMFVRPFLNPVGIYRTRLCKELSVSEL